MAHHYYRNRQLEQALLDKINAAANKLFNGNVPREVQARITVETEHILNSGSAALLTVAAAIADYSAAHGYPVGIRGLIGNLYIAHLLGIAVNDPLELGLPWEGCLGLDGKRTPEIFLNVADEVYRDLRAHLGTILPECDVLLGIPASETSWGIVIVPKSSGAYDPDDEYLRLKMCPNKLLSRVGKALRKAGTAPAGEGVFDEALIVRAYSEDAADIPVLGDLDDFQDLACTLEPRSFPELVKVMGLSLAPDIQFQADRLMGDSDRFAHLTGTREDVYDLCVRHGIGKGDALHIMRRVGGGGFGKLTPKYREMIAAHGICGLPWNTLRKVEYLYPRGQCADYIYWALTLLARRCRV